MSSNRLGAAVMAGGDMAAEPECAAIASLARRRAASSGQGGIALVRAPARTRDPLGETSSDAWPGVDPGADSEPVVCSDPMRRLFKLAGRAAVGEASDGLISVLLLGECGVGKDVLARWIHAQSPRARQPFIAVNCGTFTETLLSSELFGHERGAFTDARTTKIGILEAAAGGTVFLDEVGDMPLHLQVRLLHAVENRTIMRVGDAGRARAIDVRFIAATNRDVPAMVASGAFREDLYYRLNQITLTVPPLRERREEIEPLARRFLARVSAASATKHGALRFVPEALDVLRAYPWPGNVRELRNMIDRALVLCEGSEIRVEHLDMEKIRKARLGPEAVTRLHAPADPLVAARPGQPAPAGLTGAELAERARIVVALAQCSYNQKRAAARLNISRGTLFSRMRRYGIPGPRAGTVDAVRTDNEHAPRA